LSKLGDPLEQLRGWLEHRKGRPTAAEDHPALRHTYATTALNSGVAAQNVARLLGHKDGATALNSTRLYQ